MAETKKIAIIGAGGWGTGLSIVLGRSRAPHHIALWAREQDVLDSLRNHRKNPAFLPGFTIPNEVEVTGDLRDAVEGADIIIGAMPSAHARELYVEMLPFFARATGFVSATKGL
ncbi:MAG: NAD(P)-binding domain-containing protein, partial [Candidatus Acidiferrales bacterium]